jgi:hypothetical protein
MPAADAAQRQLDAYNARDVEAFLAAYAADCTVRSFPAGTLLMDGREAMRDRYATLFADHPDLHCELVHRVEHESFVIDHEHVTGLRAGEVVHAVAVYEVRDGLIANVWFLRDE